MIPDSILLVSGIFLILFNLARAVLLLQSLLRRLKTRKYIALLRTNPHEIPLYTEQPLHLALKPSVLTREFSWKGHLLLFAIWFGLVIVFGIIGFFLAPATSTPLSDTLLAEALIFGSFSALMLLIHVLITVIAYQRIEASETELIVQRWLIRQRISWDQARLFAANHRKGDKNKVVSNWDELSDGKKVLCWEYDSEISRPAILQFSTLQFSPVEYSQELACLRSYIHAKTNLPLRDLRSFV